MFTAKIITALTLAACVSVPLAAETVLTDHNLDQLELMIPKLQQLQQRPQNNQFNLQQHCDWSKHYQQLSAQEKDKNYQKQIEQLVKQHGFTPQQFVELSAKVTWPVLDSIQPALQVSQQALMFVPAAQRQNAEKSIRRGQQYYQTLTGCLTAEDKTALARHNDRIMQIAKRLGGVEQLLPAGVANSGRE